MGSYDDEIAYAESIFKEMMELRKEQIKNAYMKRLDIINENVKNGKWDPDEALYCMTIQYALKMLDKL